MGDKLEALLEAINEAGIELSEGQSKIVLVNDGAVILSALEDGLEVTVIAEEIERLDFNLNISEQEIYEFIREE